MTRHEAGGVRRVDADGADADRAVVSTHFDVDAGHVLDVDRAEGVVRREHRGRAGIQTEHGGRLATTVLADHVLVLVHILGAPDRDITRTGSAKLAEIQAALIETPVCREAVARATRGSGLVLVHLQGARAEPDDTSGGEVAVEVGGLALMHVDVRFGRTGRAELEVGVHRIGRLHDKAAAGDGDGVVLASSTNDVFFGTQGIDDRVILQDSVGRVNPGLVGGGGQSGSERSGVNNHVRTPRYRGEASGAVGQERLVVIAHHPRGDHAVGDGRSTGADDETDVVVDAVRYAEIGGVGRVDDQGRGTRTGERGGLQADAAVAGLAIKEHHAAASNGEIADDFRGDRQGGCATIRAKYAKDGSVERQRRGVTEAIDHRGRAEGAAVEVETAAGVERHRVRVGVRVRTRNKGAVGQVARGVFIAEGELAEDVDGTAGAQGTGGGRRGLVDDEVRTAVDDRAAGVGVEVTRRDRTRAELHLLAGQDLGRAGESTRRDATGAEV